MPEPALKYGCIPMDISLHGILLSKFLSIVSSTCDKRADIEFNGKKYVVREVVNRKG